MGKNWMLVWSTVEWVNTCFILRLHAAFAAQITRSFFLFSACLRFRESQIDICKQAVGSIRRSLDSTIEAACTSINMKHITLRRHHFRTRIFFSLLMDCGRFVVPQINVLWGTSGRSFSYLYFHDFLCRAKEKHARRRRLNGISRLSLKNLIHINIRCIWAKSLQKWHHFTVSKNVENFRSKLIYVERCVSSVCGRSIPLSYSMNQKNSINSSICLVCR